MWHAILGIREGQGRKEAHVHSNGELDLYIECPKLVRALSIEISSRTFQQGEGWYLNKMAKERLRGEDGWRGGSHGSILRVREVFFVRCGQKARTPARWYQPRGGCGGPGGTHLLQPPPLLLLLLDALLALSQQLPLVFFVLTLLLLQLLPPQGL